MYLMNKDTPVMQIDISKGVYELLEPKLLPFQLKQRFRDMPEITGENPKYEATQYAIALATNNDIVTRWLASRVLPLTRRNAKKIYQLFGYEQLQDDPSKARIAVICRAASLQDNFWIKLENDKITWDEINLRKVHLNEVVAQVSLHGSSLTLDGKGDEIRTPELNGQGAYAKAWIREKEGLFLHKKSAGSDDKESHIEVCVSNILDKCNVEHVRYLDGESNGFYTCKCKCMTTEDISILPGMDFFSWQNVLGNNGDKALMSIDKDNIYKMFIVDYLIANRDRHGMNWGLFYDANKMDIISCHPLFDHNDAFNEALMNDKDADYLFDKSMTMKTAAMEAFKRTDFHFKDAITKDDFMDTKQYDCFMNRAAEIGIEMDRYNELDKLLDTLEAEAFKYLKLDKSCHHSTDNFNKDIEAVNKAEEAKKVLVSKIRNTSEAHPEYIQPIRDRILNRVPDIYDAVKDTILFRQRDDKGLDLEIR